MKFLDRLFEFCSSVKLAVVVILLLAVQLAAATFYEARYGAAAAQARVYSSPLFLLTMALLAINVMGAAVIRYPWTRKQTGFLITHLGLEVLLAGCLISYRYSVDGRVMLKEGDTITQIALRREQLGVTLGRRNWTLPVDLWAAANYPSLPRFVYQGFAGGNERGGEWTPGKAVTYTLDKDVTLQVLDWLPAAKLEQRFDEDIAGEPAVKLRIGGTTPMGQRVPDQVLWVHDDHSPAAMAKLFDGLIEVSLWKAREDAEVAEFLNIPELGDLGKLGRVTALIAGKVYHVPVEANLKKTVPLGSGWSLTVDDYLPQAAYDAEKRTFVRAGNDPASPVVHVHLIGPKGEQEHYVSAAYPFLPSRFVNGDVHARIAKGDPVLLYDHPAILGPHKTIAGQLQLLQGADGALYARVFGAAGLKSAARVALNEPIGHWVGLTVTAEEHVAAARKSEGYVPAHVLPKNVDETMKAMKVALTVAGKRHELWLPRGGGAQDIPTRDGQATLSYGYEGYPLPFTLSLLETRRDLDPGSNNPAAFMSKILVSDRGGRSDEHLITMNHPATLAGLTFYQSGFDDQMPGATGPVSFLSVRRDPGWPVKYAGCALVVAGIFTMFYMKAYFQKPAGPPQRTPSQSAERELSEVAS